MKPIPRDILTQYEDVLKKKAVPVSRHADYRKWLQYYLDFRGKYALPDSKSEHVRLFIEKLQEKNQTPERLSPSVLHGKHLRSKRVDESGGLGERTKFKTSSPCG